MSEVEPIAAKQTSAFAYLGAIVGLILIAAVFILAVLFIRPEMDPLVLISGVIDPLLPTIAAVLAYMKSQETHLSVNSQLDAWKKEFARMVRAEITVKAIEDKKIEDAVKLEGHQAGVKDEQARKDTKS